MHDSDDSADPFADSPALVGMSAFYVKNVPSWERVLRLLVSLLVVGFAVVSLDGILRIALSGGAVMFALTGLFGFCPACAMVGRRLA